MTSVGLRDVIAEGASARLAPASRSPQDALDAAVNGLRRTCPLFSAAESPPRWQVQAGVACLLSLPLMLLAFATGNGDAIAIFFTLIFSAVIALRTTAIVQMLWPRSTASAQPEAIETDLLPVFSVLVPLYLESAIAPALVQSLAALDYPASKLDIIFITEANDLATRNALSASTLQDNMRVLTVPPGNPQTKPRALNYALQFVYGDYVSVFDAEDVPAPRQLRAAAERFAMEGTDLVCLQARLSVYNGSKNFVTRQFALEYASLFGGILPALQRLGLPILLGGTSNHFKLAALTASGGWDAHNVTEDADIGIRLARQGGRIAMLESVTQEEAPATLRIWFNQRTRWLKGWIQTYLVHMRQPSVLWRDLGPWRFFGLQLTLGGMILSALVHPWFFLAAVYELASGRSVLPASGGLWTLCWVNLLVGYAVGITLATVAALQSGGSVALRAALLVPVYWLGISAASYWALIEFYRRPYHWAKTPHSARELTDPAENGNDASAACVIH